MHTADAGVPRGQKIKRHCFCLSIGCALCSGRNGCIVYDGHDNGAHNNLTTISAEDNDGLPVLSLSSPPKETLKTDCQNKWNAKEAYVQALASQATRLVGRNWTSL